MQHKVTKQDVLSAARRILGSSVTVTCRRVKDDWYVATAVGGGVERRVRSWSREHALYDLLMDLYAYEGNVVDATDELNATLEDLRRLADPELAGPERVAIALRQLLDELESRGV